MLPSCLVRSLSFSYDDVALFNITPKPVLRIGTTSLLDGEIPDRPCSPSSLLPFEPLLPFWLWLLLFAALPLADAPLPLWFPLLLLTFACTLRSPEPLL